MIKFQTKRYSCAFDIQNLPTVYPHYPHKRKRYYHKYIGKHPGPWFCIQFLWFVIAVCRKPF